MSLRRWLIVPVLLATSLTISLFSAVTVAGPAHAAVSYSDYVMGYFVESPNGSGSNYGLHIAVSTDSLHWMPLNQNNPVVTPTAGTKGLRDPYFLRKQDGTFEVLATDLNGSNFGEQNQYIHIWDSTDLRTFTNYRRVKMHSMPTHTWAPEAFWDASRGQYGIIYSAYNGTRDVIMVNYTTDFRTVSAPQVYFDPGFNVLDATTATSGSTHYLYFKRTSDSTILGAKSSSLAPGAFNNAIYTSALGASTEAPIVNKSLTSNTWYLWDDNYNKTFSAFSSTNLANNSWSAVNRLNYDQPIGAKHATIQPITSTEYNNLIAKWGRPAWNRLKSYDFPDRYVRHYNFVGQIDVYPFDQFADMEWRLVPGLADSGGVSFESVNYPGRYLRHYNFALRVDASDGTTAFKQDATFYRTAGLASSSGTSFRSFNYPTYYIRHYNYKLRIDPISTALDKQDATFLVGY